MKTLPNAKTILIMIDKHIKNIIFDFGGVILNINPLITYNRFNKLGLANLYEGIEFSNPDEALLLYEKGLISSNDFRKKLKEKLSHPIEDCEIDEAWNAMLLDIPIERVVLLNKLKTKYNTYLLSNTNEIHYIAYTNLFKQNFGYPLSNLFNEAYFSFMLHLNKPNKEIYQYVINQNSLVAEETLFIDDSIVNIEGAKAVGLKTHHLTANETINDYFNHSIN